MRQPVQDRATAKREGRTITKRTTTGIEAKTFEKNTPSCDQEHILCGQASERAQLPQTKSTAAPSQSTGAVRITNQ